MTTLPNLYDLNMAKVSELTPDCQWAAEDWMRDCQQLNLRFRIIEAYRTQKRQDQLYAQGRTTAGKIVTWTRNSMHTARLAVDITPLSGSIQDIEQVANRYGIYRPKELVKLGDTGHFQFEKVSKKPQVNLDPKAAQRRLKRLVELETNPTKKARLLKRLRDVELTFHLSPIYT